MTAKLSFTNGNYFCLLQTPAEQLAIPITTTEAILLFEAGVQWEDQNV
jgi:hypothetical protein